MRALTLSVNRTGENVRSKTVHMEGDFRKTHEWSTGVTGAGILERDGKTTWDAALRNMFDYYFDLLPIMGDRASSQPKFTNSNPSDLDLDPDDEEEASFHPGDREDDDSVDEAATTSAVAVVAELLMVLLMMLLSEKPQRQRRRLTHPETPLEFRSH